MPEEIFDVASSIEYQENAIVSRELMKKEVGNITIFAFDKGQGLSEHTAPFDALMYIVDGSAEVKISGEGHLLRQGQMLIAPAGKPHELKAVERFKMVLVMLKA